MNEIIFEKGDYRIVKWHDDCPENPWDAWDTCAPMCALSWHYGRPYFSDYGISDNVPELTRQDIIKNLKSILNALDYRIHWISALRDICYDYPSLGIEEAVNAAISDYVENCPASDKLDRLAEVYCWAGMYAETFARHGYCQGDYAELLFVATPEWIKSTGISGERDILAESFRAEADLFASWAFGDVYGFSIEHRRRCDCCNREEWETLFSCGGFYGDNDENSGLLESAMTELKALQRDK